MKDTACLYLVGDANQLQPVGPTMPPLPCSLPLCFTVHVQIASTPIFQRIISSGQVPVQRLSQVYRQVRSMAAAFWLLHS